MLIFALGKKVTFEVPGILYTITYLCRFPIPAIVATYLEHLVLASACYESSQQPQVQQMPQIEEIWIGLADIGAMPGNQALENSKGAFVQVLATANSNNAFVNMVTKHLQCCDFFIKTIDEIEPFESFRNRHSITDELLERVKMAQNEGCVILGTLHSYDKDETTN